MEDDCWKHPHAQPFAKRININSDGARLWAPQVERTPRSFAGLFTYSSLRGVEDRNMEPDSWGILAFVGCLILLVLFIKDWETKAGADKLSRMKLPHHSALGADPDLKLASGHSPPTSLTPMVGIGRPHRITLINTPRTLPT
jgi:hypothetical protein